MEVNVILCKSFLFALLALIYFRFLLLISVKNNKIFSLENLMFSTRLRRLLTIFSFEFQLAKKSMDINKKMN